MTVRKRKRAGRNGRTRTTWMIHVHFTHRDGTTTEVRKVSPVQTRRGAERYEREVRAALLAGTYGKEEKPPAPTLAEFSTEFMENYVKVNNKHSTILSKTTILRHHLVPYFGKMRLDQIGLRHIERYKASRVNTHKKKTINNHLRVLRKLLVVAQEWGFIDHVPAIRWMKAPDPEFQFLDFDEAERFLAAVEDEPLWHAMIEVALNTGLRHGELRALEWGDVDLKRRRLIVRRSVARGVVGTPKNGRVRELPLNDRALAALSGHQHLRGPLVFCNEDGSRLTRHQCKWPLIRAPRRSRIAKTTVTWHVLRHTFASHLVMKGAPLKAVQELMGHATIEMTMRYSHLSPAVVHHAIGLLDHGGQQHLSSTNWPNQSESGS